MIIKKPCPWCGNKISSSNIGSRPKKTNPKWYALMPNIQVCPYCANGIKISGKARYGLLAFLPLFTTPPLKYLLGAEHSLLEPLQVTIFIIALIGIAVALLGTYWEKVIEQ